VIYFLQFGGQLFLSQGEALNGGVVEAGYESCHCLIVTQLLQMLAMHVNQMSSL
jgi:hypothetical protein